MKFLKILTIAVSGIILFTVALFTVGYMVRSFIAWEFVDIKYLYHTPREWRKIFLAILIIGFIMTCVCMIANSDKDDDEPNYY